jgi:hypothetical protein
MLIVPGAGPFRATPVPQKPLRADLPQPYWGSRILRDNSLILVITGVEAGDRTPPRRSAADRACAPDVGGQRRPVVDTWTSRRLCTGDVRRPRSVPAAPPARPQSVPRPADCRGRDGVRAGRRGAGTRSAGLRRTVRTPRGGPEMTGCDLAHTRSPQPVHIPGDNSSTSRLRRVGEAPLDGHPRGSALSTPLSPGCGQAVLSTRTRPRRRPANGCIGTRARAPGQLQESGGASSRPRHCRARLLMRAVSSVTCV